MTEIILFTGLIVGLNCIPLLIKTNFPKTEKVIVKLLIASTILFLTFTIFEYRGYKLKGLYTFPIIALTFIITTILYYAIFKNTKQKILTVFLLTPLIVLSISLLLFGRVEKEFRLNNDYKISISTGGFMACGENIHITKSKFGIFDKQVFYVRNLCLLGIYDIKTVSVDKKHAEFLIFHNGQNDSENPYKYVVERKDEW